MNVMKAKSPAGTPGLRDYQLRATATLNRAAFDGHKRILLVSPTGSGKTVLAAAIISARVKRGKSVLFIAHRRELITQASRKLDDVGIDHGVIMADHPRHRPELPVQIGSIQTLTRRTGSMADFDTIFIDECHHAAAKSYRDLVKQFPHAFIVGLTATPCRSDGAGLADLFTTMVEVASVEELTQGGYLVPVRVFAPSQPDLEGVKIRMGDFDDSQLAKAVDQPTRWATRPCLAALIFPKRSHWWHTSLQIKAKNGSKWQHS